MEQRMIWRDSLDWNKLQRLDLANLYPSSFFEQLMGCVPRSEIVPFYIQSRGSGPVICGRASTGSELFDFGGWPRRALHHQLREGHRLALAGCEHTLDFITDNSRPHAADHRHRRKAPPVFSAEQLDELCKSSISHLELDLELQENGVVRIPLQKRDPND